jgi:hypothetical protein
MTSPTEGRDPVVDRRPELVQSIPAPIVPVGGQESVVAAVHQDQPTLVDETVTSSGDAPTEHRVDADTRPRLKGRGDRSRSKKKMVATATVVVVVVVVVVLFSTLSGTSGPSPRYQALMDYDQATGQLVLVGGEAPSANGVTSLTDMWNWTGSGWSKASGSLPQQVASWLPAFQLVYDPVTHQQLLVSVNNTWVWKGRAWHAVSPGPFTPGPPLVEYDGATRQLVMVTGVEEGVTEIWNGSICATTSYWLPATAKRRNGLRRCDSSALGTRACRNFPR